jgi:hypothetical protein
MISTKNILNLSTDVVVSSNFMEKFSPILLKSETPHNLSSLFGIGLTDLPKIGGAKAPDPPPPASLEIQNTS